MKSKLRSLALKAVCFCLAAALLTASGCSKAENELQTTAPEETTAASVDATKPDAPQNTTAPAQDSTEATQQDETTTAAQAPATTEDIVTYFNESANKIKTQAASVTKNFEKRLINKDKLVMPQGLESVADGMISTFMKDDTEPIVYTGKEEIKENFIVPGQSYVSKLDPAYVTKATCTDNGDTYKIYLKLKSQTNPTSGNGVGAVCDVIEATEIADKAPFIEKFTTEYYNCEITATVDKATGRVTAIVYSAPLTLNITVNLFGTHDLSAGLTFVKDYTVKY